MNYLLEIKAFYDLVQIKPLPTGAIVLWHALMSINNQCAWCEWFTAPNRAIEARTGLSRSTIFAARNTLIQAGMIEYRSRKTKAPMYKMLSLTLSHFAQATAQDTEQDTEQDTKQDTRPLNKQKHKQKLSPNGDNNPPYPPTALDEAIERFKAHRAKLKKPMTDHAVDLLRKKLAEMAADEETQIAILDQSIFNGWQGVFHLRDDAQPGKASGGGDRLAHLRAMYDKYERQERQNEIQ